MKNISSVSKRALAVFMAAMMLFSFAFVNSFAAIAFTLTEGNDGSSITLKASAADCTYAVTSPSGASTTQKDSLITLTTPAAGTYSVEAKNADQSDTGTVSFTAEKVTLTATVSDTDRSLTVSNSANVDMTYFAKGVKVSVNGDFFYNLKSGTAYTIIGYKYDAAQSKLYFGEVTTQKLKESQNPPASVKATPDVNKITVEKITGAEYMLVKSSDGSIVKDWSDTNVFTDLESGVFYTVSARYKATETKLASEPATVSVKTYLANPDTPNEVTFDEVTKTSVTLTFYDGYEYSKDNQTWQDSNTFTGLTAGKDYVFYQRIAATQDRGSSAVAKKSVRTNTADIYEADMKKVANMKWTEEGNIRVGAKNGFTLYGDIRNDGNIQWGDTRIVPITLTDGNVIVFRNEMTSNKEGSQFKGYYTPTSTGEKTITVTYVKEVYKGVDGWEQVGEPAVQNYKITALRSLDGFWGVLVKVLNFLGGDLPSLLMKGIAWLQEHGVSFLIFF